jgi:D-alanyl-D-alanine dipeptidase
MAQQSAIIQDVESPLTDILTLDSSIVLDIKYATSDNFLATPLYAEPKCYLRLPVALRVIKAHRYLQNLGYGLKIYDCYRPLSVQERMWEKVPNPRYVADPKKGSNHNRGCAVDAGLVDKYGRSVPMPTEFDNFTPRAQHGYDALTEEQMNHRELLKEAMAAGGLKPITSEWWHYYDPDCRDFEILDIPIGELK